MDKNWKETSDSLPLIQRSGIIEEDGTFELSGLQDTMQTRDNYPSITPIYLFIALV